MSSKEHFLVRLAGVIASADWPDTTAAEEAVLRMKESPSSPFDEREFQTSVKELDVLVRDLTAARRARVKSEREGRESRERQQSHQRRAIYQPRPEQSKKSAHNELGMEF